MNVMTLRSGVYGGLVGGAVFGAMMGTVFALSRERSLAYARAKPR